MEDLQKFMQRNLRRIVAIGGVIISLLALSVLLNTSPKNSVWMVTHAIPSGTMLRGGDVELVKVNLNSDTNHYDGASDTVVGQYATRLLQSGDLIAVTDINRISGAQNDNYLPLGIGVDDLPTDLSVGDLVDIYVIPKDSSVLPAPVARRVVIQSIDQKSRSLGGNVAITVMTSRAITSIIVIAESQGRLVIARVPF